MAHSSHPQYRVLVEKDVPMWTRDGVTLRADVYRPHADGRFPVLLSRLPYDKNSRPLLDAVSAHVFHLGPLGAGLVGKVANNLILGVGRLAIAEAFAMAKQAGVPLDTLYHTLRTCTAESWLLRSLEGAILRGEYPPATFHGLKDLTAAVESGRSVHQAMPLTTLARERHCFLTNHSNTPGERRPTGREPGMDTEPALWAVSSEPWLGECGMR